MKIVDNRADMRDVAALKPGDVFAYPDGERISYFIVTSESVRSKDDCWAGWRAVNLETGEIKDIPYNHPQRLFKCNARIAIRNRWDGE